MLKKPMRPCPHPGCPELTRGGPCPAHKRERDKQHDQERGSAAARGYGHNWRKVRLMVLAEEPLCRECTKLGKVVVAEHVDHIDGDVTNLARENLQPLCGPCHSSKTVCENGGLGNHRRQRP